MNANGRNGLPKPKLELDPAGERAYLPGGMSAPRQEVLAVLLSVLIGLASGFAVVWLRLMIDGARVLLQGRWFDGPRIVLVPLLGVVIAAVLVQKFSRLRLGPITNTRASLYLSNGYVSLRSTIAEFLSSAVALGTGNPLGPEDPLLHVGAGLSSLLARTLRLPRERLARLAPVGAAAGLAGALNAPLAAVLFVIEAVIGSWTAPAQIGLIVLGSLSSVMVVRHFLGSQALFPILTVRGNAHELPSYLVIGIIASVVGLGLVRVIRFVRARSMRLPGWTYPLQVAVGGIAVGIAAYFGLPQVMGVGYNVVGQLMVGQFGWKLLVLMAAMKLLLAAFSFATRTPGGIIAPTLFIGAMLGAGTIALHNSLTGHTAASAPAFVVLGMSAMFAAVLRAPLASALLAIELSGSDSMIIPAIVVVGTSWLLAVSLQRRSLLDALMDFERICLPEIEERKPVPVLQVQDAMQAPDFPVVNGSSTLREAWRQVAESSSELIFVRHADACWTTVERSLLDRLEAESNPQQRVEDVLAEPGMPQLFPDLPLDMTLRHLHRWPVLPVVSRADVSTLEGVITMEAVMYRYQSLDDASQRATVDDMTAEQPRFEQAVQN